MNVIFKLGLGLLGLFVLPAKPSFSAPLYDGAIYHEELHDAVLDQSLTDLKKYLEQGTRKTFQFFPYTRKADNGIYVLLKRPGLLPSALDAKLTNASIEDFVLAGDKDKLLLVAAHPAGLARAIYSYLDRLGFKWYFPGDEWTVVPSLTQITLTVAEHVSPSFKVRNFNGTGGIVPSKTLDPASSLPAKWDAWKRRNRMGGQYTLDGHYGETFNTKYRAQLEQHPEYLASVGGKRLWSAGAKWCISNKAFRTLFITDRVTDLQARLKGSKYGNEPIVLTVDPADGAGDCEGEECTKLGSPSDRTFFLANEVAKEFQKISSRAYANIYAYHTHAAPPPFSLSPHLLVQVIPYAFQTTGTPEQMIGGWKKRQSNLLMYDYYGIPDWNWNSPLTGPDIGLPAWIGRLKYWKAQDIKGFALESSYSIGSTGLGLYLTARLGWDIRENTGAVLQSFYTQCFGSAAAYVQSYFEKTSTDFAGAADLPYLIDLLYKAGNSTKDAQVQQRISLLKSYVHYLVLFYQKHQNAGNEAFMNPLFQYVLQIYPSAIVHSTRLAELLYYQLAQGSALQNTWKLYDPPGPGVSAIKFIDNQKIEDLFLQDRKEYPLLEGFTYSSKRSTLPLTIRDKKKTVNEKPEGMSMLFFPETYAQATANGTITFLVKVDGRLQQQDQLTVPMQLIDAATGKEVVNRVLKLGRTWDTVQLKGVAGKTYRLVLSIPGWISFAVPSNQWLAFKDIPTYTVMGRLWFYNENGDKYLYYSNVAKDQPVVLSAEEKPAELQKVNNFNLYRFVLNSKKGWWGIDKSQYLNLQFHNKNMLFFPHTNLAAGSSIH